MFAIGMGSPNSSSKPQPVHSTLKLSLTSWEEFEFFCWLRGASVESRRFVSPAAGSSNGGLRALNKEPECGLGPSFKRWN
jgi:hypothetical protein